MEREEEAVKTARNLLENALSIMRETNTRPTTENRRTMGSVGTQRQVQGAQGSSESASVGSQSLFTPSYRRSQSFPTRRPPWMTEHDRKSKKKSKKIKLAMWEHEFICLANTDQAIPPNPMEKAELINAGLGPKKISIFEYGEAFEFHDELLHAFPKLVEAGGYELLRTLPNNNRQLCVIPPQSGGYTAQYLKSIVGNAKVFIRPLQKNLSLKRLLDDTDLGIAPCEKCMKCLKSIPLFQLKEHLDGCNRREDIPQQRSPSPYLEEIYYREQSPPSVHNPAPIEPTPIPQQPANTPPLSSSPVAPPFSPITPMSSATTTQLSGSTVDIDLTLDNDISVAIQKSIDDFQQQREIKTLGDIVLTLRGKCNIAIPDVNSENWENIPRTSIDVRRDFVVADGIREARKKRFHTSKLLKVSFVSEAGIDTGGPMREFYRLFAKGVGETYCAMNGNGECFFVKNVLALQNEDFKNIGKIIAMSIVQGGSGIPIFHSSVYKYICTGNYLGLVDKDKAVPDEQVQGLLSEINGADTNDKLRQLFDDDDKTALVYETGYTKALCLATVNDKDGLVNALRDYHSLIKIKAELDQFSEGLRACDVLTYVQKYPELMSPMFCVQPSKLSKEYFKKFDCCFSSNDPQRKAKEEASYLFFMDFLEECEDETCQTDSGKLVTLEDILIFFTGADKEPPLGFDPKPSIAFQDSELATSSTCTMRLRIPYRHSEYGVFKERLILSMLGNDGLGNT